MQYLRMISPGRHRLPPLPYQYDALEPVISSTTLHYHHDIHHKTYVDDLNKAEIKLSEARKSGNFDSIKCLENDLAFNGSGHILHSIYWKVMSPRGAGGQPGPNTLNKINEYFGSFQSFKEQFTNVAIKVEGSGWAILTWQPTWQRLEILQAEKHQNLTQWSGIPILVLDVWEHAYYLDYKSGRKNYVNSWWQLVNWNEVEMRLVSAMRGQMPLIDR
ncbi:MAG TPA: superoxide dismutase [Clostridia bacterium]